MKQEGKALIEVITAAMKERAILEYIAAQWKSLREPYAPLVGVWIRRYPPVPLEADGVGDETAFPIAVWFLDEQGLRRENVWKWRRF